MQSDRRALVKRLGLPAIYLALFLSGAAALVYQATWGRMLQRVFGVSDQAIATVLAAFFLGLGIGAALGGRWGTKFRRPALTYAALEAGIGVFALLSLVLIPRVHGIYAAAGGATTGVTLTAIRLVIALALLLPPTILMGATLPVLIALLAPDRKVWSTPATWLYATNTVGAMVGAGLTGLYLVPQLGTRMAIVVAAAASLLGAALVAAVWYQREIDPAAADEDGASEQDDAGDLPEPASAEEVSLLRTAMIIATLAGVASLASEVLWTRVLRMVLVGTTQSFSAMLVNYLAGIALGSLLAAELMRRGYKTSLLLGISQLTLGVLTVVAMAVAPHLPRLIALLHGSENTVPYELSVILLVSGILLFPIALVLGTSIPLCWNLARSAQKRAARDAGRILAANTLGGLVGSMVAGFGAVPLLGIELSLLCVMFLHLIIAGIALQIAVGRGLVLRVAAVASPLAVGMLLLASSPTLHLPFMLQVRTHPGRGIIRGPDATWDDDIVFMEEGRNTTVTVVRGRGTLGLYNDGRPESQFLAYETGIGIELVVLGNLPNLYAEPRDKALVIGLGAGHTATMMLLGPWQEVHVVELEQSVIHAARFMHEQRDKPFPLDDPRVRVSVDDARAQLVLAGEGSLDAVVSQPSHPWLAGSSALYTQEFFREAQRALRPTGVFSLWVNLFRIQSAHVRRVLATLTSVFPHVHAFVVEKSSLILCASMSPLSVDDRFADRYAELGIAKYLAARDLAGFSKLAAARELDAEAWQFLPLSGVPPIVDDRPALEFELASLPFGTRVSVAGLDEMFAPAPWMSPAAWSALPEARRLSVLQQRIDRTRKRPVALARLEQSLAHLPLGRVEGAIVHGSLAAARGDLDQALERLDSVEDERAADLADQLRFHQGRFRELIERSKARRVSASDPAPLISATLAVAKPEDLEHALVVARASKRGLSNKSLVVLSQMAESGCEGVLSLEPRQIAETDDEYALFLAERCAMNAKALSKASFFSSERSRVRTSEALSAAQEGADHASSGNPGGAILYLRRALSKDPSHGVAAATLAEVLMSLGDKEAAAGVLESAMRATRGLPSAAIVAEAAIQLGIAPNSRPPAP